MLIIQMMKASHLCSVLAMQIMKELLTISCQQGPIPMSEYITNDACI